MRKCLTGYYEAEGKYSQYQEEEKLMEIVKLVGEDILLMIMPDTGDIRVIKIDTCNKTHIIRMMPMYRLKQYTMLKVIEKLYDSCRNV